jgi:long-subunit fatty acid transport protein
MEDIPAWGYTIVGSKSLDLSGLSLNGGVFWDPSASMRVAVIFRTPSKLTAATRTLDRYQAAGVTDISIRGEAEDVFHRPLILGAGLSWRIAERLRTGVDVSFFRWSDYRATWIGENQVRDFRDVLRIGAGAEYVSDLRLFGTRASAPLRIGIGYDPQPAKDPRSAYFVFTFGTGLAAGGFRIDLGTSVGFESGSGDKLNARRMALACGYVF